MGKTFSKAGEGGRMTHDSLGVVQFLPEHEGQPARIKLRRQMESVKRYNEW
jgi:hypothetical protein